MISAAPFGLVIGDLLAGPSSDRLGRKIVLIVPVFLFAIFTLAAAYASSPTVMVYRCTILRRRCALKRP